VIFFIILDNFINNIVDSASNPKLLGGSGLNNVNVVNVLNRLETPVTLKIGESSFVDISNNMRVRQRLSVNRVHRMLTYAGHLMQKYDIDFLHPSYEQFIRFMDFLEETECVSPSMLKYIWQIQQKFLTAFNIPFGPGTLWNYKPPSVPPSKPRLIQTPSEMYNVIHHKYSRDKVMNSFLSYTILHSCMFGWRNPSELCMLRLGDVDFDNHSIVVTEKKKHNRKRLLITDYPEIVNSRHVKSIRNWVDVWRPRIESSKSGDSLYITPCDGSPLREMQYSRYITYYVNPLFPVFKPYNTRHFCATGLLIREKLKCGVWDKFVVKRWLGHERESTTDVYVCFAEQFLKLAGYDWFKRILRQEKISNQGSFYNQGLFEMVNLGESTILGNNALLNQFSPVVFGDCRTKTNMVYGGFCFDKNRFLGVVGFWFVPFFFFSLESCNLFSNGCVGVGG